MKGSTELEKKTIIRPVKFDYFQLVCVESDGNGNTKELNFDFIQWMNQAKHQLLCGDDTVPNFRKAGGAAASKPVSKANLWAGNNNKKLKIIFFINFLYMILFLIILICNIYCSGLISLC